jgi:hypothetical protein
MAIFESQGRRKPGTRSNTKLLVSGGSSPAEQWIVDPSLPVLFNYDYGGMAQREVQIGKGMVVGVLPAPIVNFETGLPAAALTIAGLSNSQVVGVAPYNFTKHHPDFLDGNLPSIITREYIELPYIPNASDASEVKYGAVTGPATVNIGDRVTYSRDPNNYGKMIKFDSTIHAYTDIVGQVLATEIVQEAWGWLKWALWNDQAKQEDLGPVNKSGYQTPDDGGYPYDPDFSDGVIDLGGYLTQYTTNPTGIPGILDGSGRAQTIQQVNFTVPSGTAAGTNFVVNLGLKNIIQGSVAIFQLVNGGGNVPDNGAFTVDYTNGMLTYTATGQTSTTPLNLNLAVNFRASFYGTPAGWDFRGSVGAIRILLQR